MDVEFVWSEAGNDNFNMTNISLCRRVICHCDVKMPKIIFVLLQVKKVEFENEVHAMVFSLNFCCSS